MLDGLRRYKVYLLPLAIFTLAVLARTIPGPRTIDDSYITYRYARNILAGNGFVYNPGEHVLGTTTPLYTILLTLVGFVFGKTNAPFPTLSLIINAIFDGLTCLLLISLGHKLSYRWAGVGTALVWAIAPYSVTFAIGGLETSLFVFLLTSIIWTYLSDFHPITALLSALSILTRPDALIMVGPLILDQIIRLWKSWHQDSDHEESHQNLRIFKFDTIKKEFFLFLVPISVWLIFATAYFKSPLPHSITAKSLAYQLPTEAAFVRLLQHYATPFLGHLTFGTDWIKIGLILYPFLFLVGFRHLVHTNPRIWPFLAYPWLYFAIFSLANPLIFRWYLTPPLLPLMFGIFIGLEALLSDIFSYLISLFNTDNIRIRLNYFRGFILPLIFIIPTIMSLRGWQIKPDHGLSRPAPEMAWYKLELLYKQAADIIKLDRESGPPTPVLAAGDVGVLGYFTGAHILDTVGLNSPITTKYYPLDPSLYVTNYAIPPDLILDQQPDYLVILEVYGRLGLLKDSRFESDYNLADTIPTDIYGSNGMLIFKKNQ